MGSIKVKRVYEPASEGDGYRILVDGMWPRGLTKEAARIDLWLKGIAPSAELRKWFSHDANKFPEFKARYYAELQKNGGLVGIILDKVREVGNVTLLYAARGEEYNNAAVLQSYLLSREQALV